MVWQLTARATVRVSVLFFASLLIWMLTACGADATSSRTADTLAIGQTLYEENCAQCHGIAGEGQPDWQQPDANGVYPAPPHDSSGHTWHHADSQLLEIIAQGGMMPNSQMPGYSEQMSEAEMRAVLAYIKTLWGEEERAFQEQMTQQIEGRSQ